MKLWLVRHAAPLIEPGTCYGAMDVEANAALTLTAATALAKALPQGMLLFSSPARRCRQLAEAYVQAQIQAHADGADTGLPPVPVQVHIDPRLAEMDFGVWEGRRWDAIGQAALDAWTRDFWLHPPGGGESLRTFMARVAAALDDAQAAQRDAIWITHAGVIRAAALLHAGVREVRDARQWPAAAHRFGEWSVLELPPGGQEFR